jgi:aspartyl-tRNA(Asn)/glutamyl-tRNA(Gln) amidotransferase subunit A
MNQRPKSDLTFLSIEQAARLLRRREISPVELVDACLERVQSLDASINAFITLTAESARRRARAAERELRRGGARSPLHGIPICLKDNFWTKGVRTTAGSKILADFVPDADSDVATRLAQAGAILLGKTNMHEFAYGITSENPHYGSVRNPWARDRISGGSSGGSAAAVATGMAFASMGTDTGGSIRIPAALCGIVGLKPTFGLVSVAGTVLLCESMDHAGPLARSVADACVVLETIAGAYPRGVARPNHRTLRRKGRKRFRLGLPEQYYFERVDSGVHAAIDAAVKTLEQLGARVERVSLPHLHESVEASTNLGLAEATSFHESQGYYPARAAEYGEDVRGRLEAGTKVRATDYLHALKVKRMLRRDFDNAFERVDAILAPASPIPAPGLGENEVEIAGEKAGVRGLLVGASRPANFTGHPALAVPCGFTPAGLPVGLQLIGPRWGEAKLLTIAYAYEKATQWHLTAATVVEAS